MALPVERRLGAALEAERRQQVLVQLDPDEVHGRGLRGADPPVLALLRPCQGCVRPPLVHARPWKGGRQVGGDRPEVRDERPRS